MLKIGVLGVGHLGKIHLKCIQKVESLDLIGFYDPNPERAASISEAFGLPAFESEQALIEEADVIDIVTPTSTHFQLASQAINAGRHVFIEKPVAATPEEARALIALAKAKGIKAQVGHVERFNPAVLALEGIQLAPMFIEAHRLANFNPRGTDVPVIHDLMIHDLDIILSMVHAPVASISASGVAVVSDTPDIANARIEFENGCVANLTASRISMKQMRKLRLFQKDAYISLDFLSKHSQIIRLYDEVPAGFPEADQLMHMETDAGKKFIHMHMPESQDVNAIQMELELFAKSIINDIPEVIGLEQGYKVLELACQISAQMEIREQKYRSKTAK